MAAKKKSTSTANAAGGGDSSMFGLTIDQFKALMELRGKDLLRKIKCIGI